jgi:hypothetical protein
MLPLWLSPSLGFGSFANSGTGGTAAVSPGDCADSPDSDCIPSRMTYGGLFGRRRMPSDCTANTVIASDYTPNSVVASDYTANSDVVADVDSLSYASGFAAGEGVTGTHRLNWAKCCADAGYMMSMSNDVMPMDFFSQSSSGDSDAARVHATIKACMEHSSDTGSGGDCEHPADTWSNAPNRCCSNYPTGNYDPMCNFDYCLKKLSPS